MPNTSRLELRRLALIGAEGRIESLRAEIAAIVALFPELKNAAGGAGGRGGRAAKSVATGKRNWNMSASQRKAVSARMKKYWAARRKEKAGSAAK